MTLVALFCIPSGFTVTDSQQSCFMVSVFMPIFPSLLNRLHDNNPITFLVFYKLPSDPNKYLKL